MPIPVLHHLTTEGPSIPTSFQGNHQLLHDEMMSHLTKDRHNKISLQKDIRICC